MSIETEKWVYDYDADEIQDAHGRAVLEACEPGAQRREQVHKAAQVLPEALALLKERMSVDAKGHPQCPCDFCMKGRDILKRAGVLK